ncbi:TIGR02391 family protein [Streptomyces sp. NPDC048291]|uniref:TIGR02391 family protein n=1 Tax=Streptomyces sp. NPDC048291 TaxID=3365530 RepID=UPI003710D3DA
MPTADWTLTADDVVALPIDDLALRVLRDARQNNEWNYRNWLLSAKQHGYRGRQDAVQALSEAWGWLINRGLVAPDVDQSANEAFFISRQGHEALTRGLPWIRAVQRLDIQMVPVLEGAARPQYLRGDFEAAALMAMKEIEVRVRAMSELPAGLVGTALMQAAFRPGKGDQEGGPLSDQDAEGGEAVAIMELFKGAIGLFKNPASHRRVDYSDPTEAAEVVLLADLLMRLLDKIETSAT